ncbi:MAG: carboxypeptidase regulatory-like domain-containing protein [Oligoflexia bacterium]|nr:carboxypeptidase regulatory-like domain-containing protein [Oligoflexia bacterium]
MGRLRIGCALFSLFFWFLWVGASAHAYISTVTSTGVPVRWPGGGIHLDLAGNYVNSSGLASTDVFEAVVHSLERWQSASGGTVSFDYWQGSDPSIYEPNSDLNGLNQLYFASNGSSRPGPNVLGLTQVWYDSKTGKILETDIVLNDIDFQFTSRGTDTSGYGVGSSSGWRGEEGMPNVFVENVITHELGHVFGLSHSAGLQSTMLFMESPEQAHLGCDEQVGIHALYPLADDARARGAISGAVISASGAPVFGAHVLAISRRRGVALATGITDSSGRYSISGLEPGTYFLLAEPYFAGSAALPSYYSGIRAEICDGKTFERSFLMADDESGDLREVDLAAGGQEAAPAIVAKCSPPKSISRERDAINGAGSGFGIVDHLGSRSAGASYSLNSLGGHFEIHALAYSLYSPIKLDLSLRDQNGSEVPASEYAPDFEGDSGYKNYDAFLDVESLPPGNYTLTVSASSLDAGYYPAGPIALDAIPYLVLTGSVDETSPPLADVLAVNGRCETVERFTDYSSPPGNPPRHEISPDSSTNGVGFCGTLSNDRKNKRGGNSQARSVIGWFVPWILMALVPVLLRVACAVASLRLSLLGDEPNIDDGSQSGLLCQFCRSRRASSRKRACGSAEEIGDVRP